MDEFLILLQAKLDEVKSNGNINADIDKIQGQLDKLKFQAEIDPKSITDLTRQIENILNQKITVSNIGINSNQISKVGQKAGEDFNNGLSQGLNKSSNILSSFKKSLQNIGMGSEEIDAVANRISNLGVQIESLNQTRAIGNQNILSVNISGIDEFGQAIKLAQQYDITTGNLIKTIDAVSTAQQKVGTSANSLQKAENFFADYTAKIEQFKSTNSNILSGLTTPLTEFENKLSELKKGNSTINEVVNSYKNLNAEASKITSNLSAQFNKVDSAVRNIAKGSETIASLKADFKGLSNAPKEVNTELSKCEKLLQNVKNIELQEGRTKNWSAAYKEWETELDSLRAKLSTLKKEQSNVASTQVFNTADLDKQGKIYLQKISNTIEKTKSELESKLRNAGYSDIEIKGVEDSKGKVKSLTATVTDAIGAFKQLNFERTKIQGNGKAQFGFVQTDDVKVIGNISSTVNKVQDNLSSLKRSWEEQGVLVGEFKAKVEQLESSLSSVGNKGELNGLKSQIQELKSEASTIAQVNKIQLSIDNGKGASEYQNRINSIIASLERYGVETKEAQKITASLQSTFDSMKGLSGQELISQADKLEQEFKSVKASVDEAKLSFDKFAQPVSDEKVSNLIIKIQRFLENNSNITKEARVQLSNYIQELNGGNISLSRWNAINAELKKTESTMSVLGKLGKSFTDQLKDIGRNVSTYLSASSLFMNLFSKTKDSISELKEIDSILTEISKTSDLTAQELEKLGSTSFTSASKFGKNASDFLLGIQEMSRSGFYGEKGSAMAEQSLLAQAAGDMTADIANKYILATNAAYKYNGEAEKLNAVLDGQNSINKIVPLYRNI